jgi:hypothetical protein
MLIDVIDNVGDYNNIDYNNIDFAVGYEDNYNNNYVYTYI